MPTDRPSWQASLIRTTIFLEQPHTSPRADWWESVVGESPAERQDFPREQRWVDTGPLTLLPQSNLTLSVQLNRIDWLLQSTQLIAPQELELSIPVFPEDAAKAIGTFARLVEKWLVADCPTATRVAFGTVLLSATGSRELGYESIGQLLPFTLDPESFDFHYQINRRRDSKTLSGCRVNRLSKWSVARFERTAVLTSGSIAQQTTSLEPLFASRLELDINSVPGELRPISGDALGAFHGELASLALEIAEQGDIK